jgi:hypothetical protein
MGGNGGKAMTFNIGDSVKVKEGVMCPDDNSICIGQWQGRVFTVEEGDDIVGINWDSITLKQLPHEYIKRSEEEGLGWTGMYLSVDEIERASPRDSEAAANNLREEMESKFCWLGEGKEGERIFKVIAHANDEVEAWHDHLTQVLSFPFDAKVSEPQDKGQLNYGDKMQVHGIAEADGHYGILVDVNCGGQHFVFPLCDLTVQDRKSPNYTPVKDYCIWFANR